MCENTSSEQKYLAILNSGVSVRGVVTQQLICGFDDLRVPTHNTTTQPLYAMSVPNLIRKIVGLCQEGHPAYGLDGPLW